VHVYVDETKAKGYVVSAAAVLTGDVAESRRQMRRILPKGQRRLHMVNESDPLRRKILSTIADLGIGVALYEAGPAYPTDILRRRACLDGLVRHAAAAGCVRLTLESDPSQDCRDRQSLIEITREAGCRDTLQYVHMTAFAEPLLWIPDAVAWAFARGGLWAEQARAVITRVVQV
jgi:hypothetical protein